jgi:hypothetical protein
MAIRFNWVRGTEKIAHVRTTWSLTREDVANILIAWYMPRSHEEMQEKRPVAELEHAIRELLATEPAKRRWWADEYQVISPGEPTEEEVRAWGMTQALRL